MAYGIRRLLLYDPEPTEFINSAVLLWSGLILLLWPDTPAVVSVTSSLRAALGNWTRLLGLVVMSLGASGLVTLLQGSHRRRRLVALLTVGWRVFTVIQIALTVGLLDYRVGVSVVLGMSCAWCWWRLGLRGV